MRWLSAFLALAAMLAAGDRALAGPRLMVAAPTFDFGTIERGTPVDHVFRVRNEGDAPANVLGIDRTCACTVGAASARTVAPGGELWVSVGLDSEALSGPVVKAVTVRTDDPNAPALRLVLRGTVLVDLIAEPPTLYVGEVGRGSVPERTARVRPGRPTGTARVLAVRARGPFVEPRVIDDGAGGLAIAVRVTDDAPAGRFRDEIVVRGSGLDGPIVIPVLGVVRADDADDRRLTA
ncbi:MAG TPA: DUF1573 domain-containing protein, partial [Candidatus Limnocylindria bacterium]|nr:DUF1573 domain-containing protein [Candidatus Limnocylindria bacterium]